MKRLMKIAVIGTCAFLLCLIAESAFPFEQSYLKAKLNAIEKLEEIDNFEPQEEGARGEEPGQIKARGEKEFDKVRVLKKSGIERIGLEPTYDEFTGLRFGKYFSKNNFPF